MNGYLLSCKLKRLPDFLNSRVTLVVGLFVVCQGLLLTSCNHSRSFTGDGPGQGDQRPPDSQTFKAASSSMVFKLPRSQLRVVLTPTVLGARHWSQFEIQVFDEAMEANEGSSGGASGVDLTHEPTTPLVYADLNARGLSLEVEEWMDMGSEGGHPGTKWTSPLTASIQEGKFIWKVGFTMPGVWQAHVRIKGIDGLLDEDVQTFEVP